MLILFDIDMTMITTGGCGMKAMADAGRELFGASFTTEGIQFAGRLDPLIISEMFAAAGVPDAPQQYQAFRTTYREHLERRLAEPGTGRALPGVLALLDQLPTKKGILVGLLTGNFEETGSMKLRACGIDPKRFSVCVWGDESAAHPPKREHLVPIGMARGGHKRGRPLSPTEVTIIGDTPHDVQCARVHGCRSLGVATGHFSIEKLQEAGADLTLPNLAETDKVLTWLMNGVESSAA